MVRVIPPTDVTAAQYGAAEEFADAVRTADLSAVVKDFLLSESVRRAWWPDAARRKKTKVTAEDDVVW